MPTIPPTITPAPLAPDRGDRATFSARATASFDHLKAHAIPEMAAVADNVYANAVETFAAIDAAMDAGLASAATNASTATEKAGIATGAAADATAKADESAASASAAAASAASASAVSGIPDLSGHALDVLRVKEDGSGMEWAKQSTFSISNLLTLG